MLSPDGRTLATTEPSQICLREFPAGLERTKSTPRDREFYRNLAFSPDGKTLAAVGITYSKDGRQPPVIAFVAWNAATLKERFRQQGPERLSLCTRPGLLSRRPDDRRGQPRQEAGPFRLRPARSPSYRRSGLFDAASGSRLRRIFIKHFDIGSLAFSPDGQTLAAGVGDRTIRRYDPSTGERAAYRGWVAIRPSRCPSRESGSANGTRMPPGRPRLSRSLPMARYWYPGQEAIGWLNGSIDEASISIWDIWRADGKVHRFFGHYGGISSLAFAPERQDVRFSRRRAGCPDLGRGHWPRERSKARAQGRSRRTGHLTGRWHGFHGRRP